MAYELKSESILEIHLSLPSTTRNEKERDPKNEVDKATEGAQAN